MANKRAAVPGADAAARPTYREALEAIGRYFDQQLYRSIFIAEVDDGYIGKARPAEEDVELRSEGFTFPSDDIRALIADAVGAPPELIDDGPPYYPYGYGVFMRAAGARCDRSGGHEVAVLEVMSGFILSYTTTEGGNATRHRVLLDRTDIENLVNEDS